MDRKRRFPIWWRKDNASNLDPPMTEGEAVGAKALVHNVTQGVGELKSAFSDDGMVLSAANTQGNSPTLEDGVLLFGPLEAPSLNPSAEIQGPFLPHALKPLRDNRHRGTTKSEDKKVAHRVSNGSADSHRRSKLYWPKLLRITRYEVCAICALIVIWGPALLLLKTLPPVFKSSWTLLIPGTTIGSSFNIDSLGEANTSIGSSYGSHAVDPKVNFKAIAMSSAVLDKAAEMSELDVAMYGEPKIRLVDQTAIMEVTSQADSAELVYLKSRSMYDAFMNELEALREDERLTNQRGNQRQLEEYRAEVAASQMALREFRHQSDVVSADQYKNLLANVAMVSDQRLAATIKLASFDARYQAMQDSLGVSPEYAGELMKLRQDLMVQSLIEEYTEAYSEMVELRSVLGSENPKYVHAKLKAGNAKYALTMRASTVLGHESEELLNTIMPNAQGTDTVLYTELIRLQSEKSGLESEIALLDDTLPILKARVLDYSEQASILEELERNFQIANTILVSASTKLDLGKSDIYASYPMTQILVAPTYPDEPGKLQKLFIVAGAIVGSLMVVLALIVLWNRKRWLQLIQKKK